MRLSRLTVRLTCRRDFSRAVIENFARRGATLRDVADGCRFCCLAIASLQGSDDLLELLRAFTSPVLLAHRLRPQEIDARQQARDDVV